MYKCTLFGISAGWRAAWALGFALAGLSAPHTAACQTTPAQDAVSQWEFGVELGSPGEAQAITAVFPIPIDWPEQTVVLGATEQTGSPADLEFLDLGTARLAVVRIPRLPAGEHVRLVIPARIHKRPQLPPAEPSTLVFSPGRDRALRPFLRPSPQIESTHRKIKDLVKTFFADDSSQPAWQQVEAIYRWVRDEIEYRFEETNRSCLDALEAKQGDCGEMTGLFIALCRAKGIPARAVWVPEHTYPEFFLQDAAGQGQWYPCQVAGDYQFGAMHEPKPILQKGDQFKVPGQAKATRYAQPTLTAEDASQPITVEWILREVEDKR